MNKDIKFGDYLKILLKKRQLKSKDLAKDLNIDSSGVRRWISTNIAPGVNSEYVEKISAILNLTDEEVNQLKYSQLLSIEASNVQKSDMKSVNGIFDFMSQSIFNPIIGIDFEANNDISENNIKPENTYFVTGEESVLN